MNNQDVLSHFAQDISILLGDGGEQQRLLLEDLLSAAYALGMQEAITREKEFQQFKRDGLQPLPFEGGETSLWD